MTLRGFLLPLSFFLPAIALAQFSNSGTRGVVTITVCALGCTTNNLQTALDSLALCGDTIQIKSSETQVGNFTLKARGCPVIYPITVTTDRFAWLPFSTTRISPSHLGNLAILSTPNTGPVLTSVLSPGGSPAADWRFVGIGLTSSNNATGTFNLVVGKSYVAANDSQIPKNITFDRCYFYSPLPNGGITGVDVNNAIYGEIANLNVKNSFFGDIARPGTETHGILIVTTPGPVDLSNNFITASSIPIFAGGTVADYPVTPTGVTVRYNYTWRPGKWLPDPASPYYADFLTNGSYSPCLKNHGEFKWTDGLSWQFNGHENMWVQAQCFSQYNGFTNTIRTAWFASVITVSMGNMTMSDTTHVAWDGTYDMLDSWNNGFGPITNLARGVCINLPLGIECRPLASYNNTTKTAVISTPFSSAPAGNKQWFATYDQQQLRNVDVNHNVFKNVAKGVNSLGLDPSNGTGNAGKLTGASISHNLFWNYNSYLSGGACPACYGIAPKGWTFTAGEEGFVVDAAAYIVDHNTFWNTTPLSNYFGFAAADNGTINRQPLWQGMRLTNNLAGPDAVFSIVGDGTTGNLDMTMSTYAANSFVQNNGMPGLSTGACTGSNTCSGNIGAAWPDPFVDAAAGNFTLKPGSIYIGAGTGGTNIGADPAQLPLVTGLAVVPLSTTALLQFDLTAPIGDAGNTQPCVLEVSSSRNLQSDLNTYAVTNDLNPTFFQQPDTSARVNPKLLPVTVAARHVSWPIGQAATVVGDDGVSHNLRLIPSTVYYGRLMCYGDTEWFSFTTLP